MVRQGLSLAQAATQLSIPVTSHEVDLIMRRVTFQRLIWTCRHRFYKELATDIDRTKISTIGQLVALSQKQTELGDFDKAAETLFKIAKLENWVGEGGQVNVFAGLSQKDIDEMKAKLEDKDESKGSVNGTEPSRPN
jgi:hypothetical protein